MRYLIDTNIWIFYLKQSNSIVEKRLRRTPAREIAVCSIVWAELLHGARKYAHREARVARIERTLSPFRSLAFDNLAAYHYAEIRDFLETKGNVIGPHDLLIASIARTHGLILVSSNHEFSRMPNLSVESWSVA